jgi:hypothetical protein
MDALRMPMQMLINEGRGLALLNGLSDYDRTRLGDAFIEHFEGSDAEAQAALMRLDAMIAVFSAQRLRDMLLKDGFMLIWQAVAVAANMRLNAEWGFNPQKFIWALQHQRQATQTAPRMTGATPFASVYGRGLAA